MAYEAYKDESLGFATRALHAGYDPARHGGSKTVPIYQTAAFQLGDYDRCIRLFEGSDNGPSYARFVNPTNQALEARMASLEGGNAALGLASGMAAISNTLMNLACAGDEIIANKTLYSGSTVVLSDILADYGIVGRFVDDPDDISAYEEMITEKTRAIYVESMGNPLVNLVDLEALCKMAHAHGVPVVVDNTVPTPYLLRPFEYGADIVVYSATKYLGGHGNLIAGIVVEKGGFDWLNGRFPQFEKFYEASKEAIGEETLKKEMFTRRLRGRFLMDMGAHMTPITAFLLLQSIETLPIRMDRHSENALRIAQFLEGHPQVERVNYPGLESSPYHALAQKYFPLGCSSMLSFDVKGGLEAAKRVLEKVRIFDYMVNIGDAKSMITHPASSTHFFVPPAAREAAGAHENTLRLIVGLEDAKDLIADLDQALR